MRLSILASLSVVGVVLLFAILNGSFLKYSFINDASLERFRGFKAGCHVRDQMPSFSILVTSSWRITFP